jgi:hypothetical protein
MPIATKEDKPMRTHFSLTGLSAAIALFTIGVAMHEAASADRLTASGVTPVAERLILKRGKKPLGFQGSGGTSHTEQCTHGTNDITVCSDCDSDGVCVVTRCVKGRTGEAIDCP